MAATEDRDRYVSGVIEAGCCLALPELTAARGAGVLYRVADRSGVAVIGISAGALDESQLATLRRFRFAQYLDAGFVDRDIVYEQRLQEDLVAAEDPDTLYFLACSTEGGLLIASMTLYTPVRAPPGTQLCVRERSLLPVEQHFGWGVYNRLAVLPELPVQRVREFGRFVKNRRQGALRWQGIRAAVELCLAATHTLTGPLALSVEAFVGQFDNQGARRNLEFFHTPMVILEGGVPIPMAGSAEDQLYQPGLETRRRLPFAALVSDLEGMRTRVAAIEAALDQPEAQGLIALQALSEVPSPAISSLVPGNGVPALANTAHSNGTFDERRDARRAGDRLRDFELFARLSDTEATTLRLLLQAIHVEPGQVIATRGRPADSLYLIEHGHAEVRGADSTVVETLGPGDSVGALNLLTGIHSLVDVVARSKMDVLRLTRETYVEFLRDLPDMDLALSRLALDTASQTFG